MAKIERFSRNCKKEKKATNLDLNEWRKTIKRFKECLSMD